MSRLELAGVVIHFAPTYICGRAEPSVYLYRVCGITLPNLVDHLIAGDLGLRRVPEKSHDPLWLRAVLYADERIAIASRQIVSVYTCLYGRDQSQVCQS